MEGNPGRVVNALGGWFCATDQAYFMELFLLISAYFIPGSYGRKGPTRFLKDRLVRLGIPLVVYCWIINPLFIWLWKYRYMPLWRFFPGEYFSGGQVLGQGPLWFVETLLIFSLVYILWRVSTQWRKAGVKKETPFPRNGVIILFAVLLGLATFLVRLFWVMDVDSFGLLNLQLPFFAQYIALFIIGLIAYRNNWFLKLTDQTGRWWLITAAVLILLWAPMMLFNGAPDGDISYRGGLGSYSLGVFSLRQYVYRFDLRFPPLFEPAGKAGWVSCTKRLHRLSHPCPDYYLPGCRYPGYNNISIA